MNAIKDISQKMDNFLKEKKLNPILVSAIISYLIITPVDAVLYLQWINSMENYKFVAGAIVFPFFGMLYFAIPTLWKMHNREITSESCPIYDLAKIGLMDSLGSIMAALTIPFISIMLNVVISKLVLPMTMFTSYFLLGKKYVWTHYVGVLITLFGVLAAAVPELVGNDNDTNGTAIFFFMCSLIPGVASYVIKERYLKENPNADPWYMNTVISIFQVAIGFLTLPLVMLPITGLNVEQKDFGNHLSNSMLCQLGGINSQEKDNCQLSFVYLLSFQLFATIANILMMTIIKEGSSVTFIMINTLKTPITALLGFALIYYNVIKFTEGESFTFTWLNVLGLVFVLIGSVFYAMAQEINEEEMNDYKLINNLDNIEEKKEAKNKLLKPLLILDDDNENKNKISNEFNL